MTLTLEDLGRAISIPELAKKIGRDKATIYTWSSDGVRGVKLRTLLVGGRRFVLPEFVEEFVTELSTADGGKEPGDDVESIAKVDLQLDSLLK